MLLLHGGVLMEIGDGYARIGRRAKGIALLERMSRERGYRVETVTEALIEKAIALYTGRSDKEWSLTDCVSFVLMEQEGVAEALTADVHFQQAGYRALLLEDES